MRGLSVKQQKFCDLYLKYGNATKAAKEAGYSGKNAGQNAAKLLKNPKIKAFIDQRLEEAASKRIADVEEVLEYLTKGVRQELTEDVVVVKGIGEGVSMPVVVQKGISLRDSTKCAELLAKRYGILDKDALTVTVNVPQFGGDDDLED